MIDALDSYFVGDLLNFFLKQFEQFTQGFRFALLRYSLALVAIAAVGAWIGNYLAPVIQGPFPSPLVGLTVVYEFTAVTSILLLVDVLLQHREFIPNSEGFLRSLGLGVDAKLSFEEMTAEYPVITRMVGEDWLRKQLSLPIQGRHILGAYLQRAFEDKPKINELRKKLEASGERERGNLLLALDWRMASVAPLNLLESCLSELASEANLETLLKELRAPQEEYYAAFSVAYFACYLKQRGNIELFPQVKVASKIKIPDLAVTLDGRRIYVEVTTPGMAQILRDTQGRVVGLKERAVGQILDEYEENFAEAVNQGMITNEPIIIALDCQRSEIDQDSVEAAIFGTAQIQMLLNKQTGELVDARIQRQNNGMKLAQGSNMISAIIWSKWAARKDNRLVIGGFLTQNPSASNKLTTAEGSKLDFLGPY